MNFIVFKIGFSKYYNGIEDENFNIYDKFYQEKKSNNPEIYNFQDYNGFCYGYASLKDGVVNLSNIEFKNDASVMSDNKTIIWVYEKDNNFYIVGWYKNATLYNFLQRELSYPSIGRDLYYNVKAKSKDCFLLPVENRTFPLNINFKKDTNFCILDDENVINTINNFINNYNDRFINIVVKNYIDSTIENAPNNPISLQRRGSLYLYNENNFLDALKYFNTALLYKDSLKDKEIIDIYYLKALTLQFLNSFDNAIIYFEKVINSIEYDIDIIKNLIYLHMYTKSYQKSIIYCDKILKNETRKIENELILDEIACLKAECYLNLNKIEKGKEILENIKKITSSENLKNYCKNLLKNINPVI